MPRKRPNEALSEMHETDENVADYSETFRIVKSFLHIENPVRRLGTLHFVEDIAAGLQEAPVLVVH